MSAAPQTVLVTGASGFIGSHITLQLLEAGYRVRGTARGPKLQHLRQHFGDRSAFEAVQIEDVVKGDFTSALQGVDAVVHVASPLAGRQAPEEALNSAVEGTLNVLRQAFSAGVFKIVLTSSLAATLDHWGNTSREDLLAEGRHPLYVYCGTKILAERAAWQFAVEHPQLDLATINPPFVYGPPVSELSAAIGIQALGTNALIYQLIVGEPGRPLPPQLLPYYCNVRDVARAHVLALQLPKIVRDSQTDIQDKRFLVAGPEALLWTDAVKVLQAKRPDLQSRLPTLEGAPPLPGPLSRVDVTRAKEVLGMREYTDWEVTLLETVDVLLEIEKAWK
ncbi:hypothetical protein C8Q79DRAFT_929284 [Trametes meyenii]|nr:hypothetical protein C8Q79DRAFT_929284 [Trametes meyenii]